MFEHVRSSNPLSAAVLDLMTFVTRHWGTEMNRDTLGNAARAGLTITGVWSVFLDLVRP